MSIVKLDVGRALFSWLLVPWEINFSDLFTSPLRTRRLVLFFFSRVGDAEVVDDVPVRGFPEKLELRCDFRSVTLASPVVDGNVEVPVDT